tara:strand:+ start:24009 stop:24590 length:582 start_codon:yes stop_codon:yes gene_type:complete
MPYSGAGVFAVYTPGTPYVTGTTISSTVANSVNSDFATGLSTAITKDGQTTTTASITFAQGIDISGGSAGAIIPTAAVGFLYSFAYTPTITNGTNVAVSTAQICSYNRVGNRVTVSGQVDIDPTAAAATDWRISLPVASAFTTTRQIGGSGASSANAAVYIESVAATDDVFMSMTATSAANQTISFSFSYLVV